MSANDKLIERLEKREKDIKNQLRKAKAGKLKREAAINDHKDRITGAAVRKEMETDGKLSTTVKSIIDKHTTNEKDRKLLGLEPLQKKPQDDKKIPPIEPVQKVNPETQPQQKDDEKKAFWKK